MTRRLLLTLLVAAAATACTTPGVSPQVPTSASQASASPGASLPAPGEPIQEDKVPAASLQDVRTAAGKEVEAGRRVRFETTKGAFEVVLFPKAAPKTVENFEKLVGQGFYDGATFHRVITGFMAQGGDPNSKTKPAGDPSIGSGGPGYTIPDEHGNGLKHLRGSLAMAHTSAPNSAGSQFYICFKPQSFLDGGYTVFGQVVAGMDTVDKLTVTYSGSSVPNGATPDKMLSLKLI